MAFDGPGSPSRELMSALGTLLEAGKYSDLTIICGQRKFHVHRAILCSRSGFFDGACSSPFREAESGIIDLSEDDEEAVEHMIHYFYHLDYLKKARSRAGSTRSRAGSRASQAQSPISPMSPRHMTWRRPKKFSLAMVEDPLLAQAAASSMQNALTPPEEEENQFETLSKVPMNHEELLDEDGEVVNPFDAHFPDQDPNPAQAYLMLHSKVYALAEKYGIAGLKSLARKKFASQMSHHYQDAEFADAIGDVYETTVDTDRGLRDVVIQTFRKHPELAQRKDVEEVVKETPGLAWELFRVGWGLPVY